jgi:hypothetical protein
MPSHTACNADSTKATDVSSPYKRMAELIYTALSFSVFLSQWTLQTNEEYWF